MTRDEILAMPAGRGLDVLVAQTMEPNLPVLDPKEDYLGQQMSGEVFYSPLGFWHVVCEYDSGDVPMWKPVLLSTRIAAAWKVVEKFVSDRGYGTEIRWSEYHPEIQSRGWRCDFGSRTSYGATPMEAICKAALLVMVPLG